MHAERLQSGRLIWWFLPPQVILFYSVCAVNDPGQDPDDDEMVNRFRLLEQEVKKLLPPGSFSPCDYSSSIGSDDMLGQELQQILRQSRQQQQQQKRGDARPREPGV